MIKINKLILLCTLFLIAFSIKVYADTGGIITQDGNYTIHTFSTVGTFTYNVTNGTKNVEVLIVAGGGGGGYRIAGGGGAGGLIHNISYNVINGNSYTVIVGHRGFGSTGLDVKGTNGDDSTFDSLTATGGGGGGSLVSSTSGSNGGSGGGTAAFGANSPGNGIFGQGFMGGYDGGAAGGGGGGSSAAGGTGTGGIAGSGGTGTNVNISGAIVCYAGGGGGGGYEGGPAGGVGSCGGGNGSVTTNAQDAINGLGSGGGGGGQNSGGTGLNGGNGGSGIVIIRYLGNTTPAPTTCSVCNETCSPCGGGCTATDLTSMFDGITNFDTVVGNISGWNTSCITNMNHLFQSSDFNQSINGWDVHNVKSTAYMFYASAFNKPLNDWNVGNIADMSDMFALTPFNQTLNNWNTSSVTTMREMFDDAPAFNQNINGWDTHNVTDTHGMFSNDCGQYTPWMTGLPSTFNMSINSWNTSKVIDMGGMFSNMQTPFQPCIIPFDQPLNNWDIHNVQTTNNMFGGSLFNQDISGWNTSSDTDMTSMFNGDVAFNQPIGSWDTHNVGPMDYMFADTYFNQDITGWDTRNANSMIDMFYACGLGSGLFDQNIGVWNVTNVVDMTEMLSCNKLSTTHYDTLLNGWSAESVQGSVIFDAGNSQYTASGLVGKNILLNTYTWTINDGGLISGPNITFHTPTPLNDTINYYTDPNLQINVTTTSISGTINLSIQVYNTISTLVASDSVIGTEVYHVYTLSPGQYLFNATANNGTDVFNTETRTIYLNPHINITNPINGSTVRGMVNITWNEIFGATIYNLSIQSYTVNGSLLCYQESANVSNQSGMDDSCGQIYTGAYSANTDYRWTDGVRSTGTNIPNDGTAMYVNYTKPLLYGLTPNAAISEEWMWPVPGVTINATILPSCINYGNIIQLKFNVSGFDIGLGIDRWCYDGAWEFMDHYNNVNFGEEAILWNTSTYNYKDTFSTNTTLTSYLWDSSTVPNNNYTITVTAYNSTSHYDATTNYFTKNDVIITFTTPTPANSTINYYTDTTLPMNASIVTLGGTINTSLNVYYPDGTLAASDTELGSTAYHLFTLNPGQYLYNATTTNSTETDYTETRTIYINPHINITNPENNTLVSGNNLNITWNSIFGATYYTINISGATGTNMQCYQESANVSNQQGTDTCRNLLYYTGAYDFQQHYMYINYTKPINAVNAQWQVKHGELSAYNATIPSICWNYAPTVLALRFFSNTNNLTTGQSKSYGECYDGSAWNTITSTATGNNVATGFPPTPVTTIELNDGEYNTRDCFETDLFPGHVGNWTSSSDCDNTNVTASIYEEGIWWNITTVTNAITVDTSYIWDPSNVPIGAQYAVNVSAYNTTNYYDSTKNYFNTNTEPVVDNVTIIPSNPRITSILEAYCRASDIDNGLITYHYRWYKNQALYSIGDIGYNITQNITVNIANLTLNASITSIGDNWTIGCTPDDNIDLGVEVNSTPSTVIDYNIYFNNATTTKNDTYITYPEINISITSLNDATLIGNTIYLYDDAGNILFANFTTQTTLSVNYNGLATGTYHFNATMVQTTLTRWTETRTVYVDTTIPTIYYSVGTATSGIYTIQTSIPFNTTVQGAFINYTENNLYDYSGLLVQQLNGSDTLQSFTGLTDGLYYFNSTTHTKGGLTNSTETRNVTILSQTPGIHFITPTLANGTYTTNHTLPYNVQVTGSYITNITVKLYDENITLINVGGVNGTFENLTDGTYYMQGTTTNIANGTNSTKLQEYTVYTLIPGTFTSPTYNETVGAHTFINYTIATSTNNNATILRYIIKLLNADRTTNRTIVDNELNTTYVWNAINANLVPGQYYIEIVAVDDK